MTVADHISRATFSQKASPKKKFLFVGNSSPIRDFDTYARAGSLNAAVFCNRGVSGIDGLISTPSGIACAQKKSCLDHPRRPLISP